MRINIPNPYGVYMHDTPSKGIFGDDFRFVSSGCVRVQDVRDYVAWLLKDNPGWGRDQIDQVIRSGAAHRRQDAKPVNGLLGLYHRLGDPRRQGPRFQEEDFHLRSSLGPQPDADVRDWPLSYADLEPYYRAVEATIGVAGLAGANPYARVAFGPYPMPPGASMYGRPSRCAAAESLGLPPRIPRRRRPTASPRRPAGVQQLRVLCLLRVPDPRQRGPVALLQRVMRTGSPSSRRDLVSHRDDGKRATGVEYIGPDGKTATMDRAGCGGRRGAVGTPRLLLLSGIGGDAVGRHLTVHYQTIVAGVLDHRLHGERGRAVTHVHDDHIVGDDATRAAKRGRAAVAPRRAVEHQTPSLPVMEAKLYPRGKSPDAHA